MLDRLVTIASSTLSPRSVAFQNSLRLAVGLAHRAAARRAARRRERLLGPVRDAERGAHERLHHGRQRASGRARHPDRLRGRRSRCCSRSAPGATSTSTSSRSSWSAGCWPDRSTSCGGRRGSPCSCWSCSTSSSRSAGRSGSSASRTSPSAPRRESLIGLAAWPRGAAGQLAQSLADAIKACGDLVAATVERRLRPVSPEQLSRLRSRARAKTLRADGVLAVFLTERPKSARRSRSGSRRRCSRTRGGTGPRCWRGSRWRHRPPEAADLVDALVDRVHELDAAHTAVAAAIGRREPPPPVRAPIDVDAPRPTVPRAGGAPAPWTIPGPSAAWSTYCERAR